MTDSSYWANFYSSKSIPQFPSQFAAFMLGELPDPGAVVDLGCGNGRDALFFARMGIPTVAVDGSESAITACREVASDVSLAAIHSDVTAPELADLILRSLPEGEQPVMLYARFFVHALNDDEEAGLLRLAHAILRQRKGVFGLEFRTHRDQGQAKVTAAHYRRYVNPADFSARAAAVGFKVQYFVEGFGLAKFKHDDAHVARFVLDA